MRHPSGQIRVPRTVQQRYPLTPDCGDDVTDPVPRPHRSGGDCELQRRHVANNGGHGTDEDHVRFVRIPGQGRRCRQSSVVVAAGGRSLPSMGRQRARTQGKRPESPSWKECQGSTETGVKHQPTHCQPSAEARMSSLSRTNSGYVWGRQPTTKRHRSTERTQVMCGAADLRLMGDGSSSVDP